MLYVYKTARAKNDVITRLEIKKFRTCENVVIDDMGSMMVFLGPNGVGKTNVLQAVKFLAEFITGTSSEDWFKALHVEIWVELSLGSHVIEYGFYIREELLPDSDQEGRSLSEMVLVEHLALIDDQGVSQAILERRGAEVKLHGTQPIRIDHFLPSLPAIRSLLPESEQVTSYIQDILTFFEAVGYYPLDEQSETNEPGIILDHEYREWVSQRTMRSDGDSVVMQLLSLNLENAPVFKELTELVGVDGLGILENIVVATLYDKDEQRYGEPVYQIFFKPSGHALQVTFGLLSLGTRRILRLVVSVLFDNRSVSLIEHPEDAVHAQLLHKVMGFLRSYLDPAQFLLTSHSPSVFNTMRPEEVRSVTIENGVTQVRALTSEEQEIAQKYVKSEGTLADFLEAVDSDG